MEICAMGGEFSTTAPWRDEYSNVISWSYVYRRTCRLKCNQLVQLYIVLTLSYTRLQWASPQTLYGCFAIAAVGVIGWKALLACAAMANRSRCALISKVSAYRPRNSSNSVKAKWIPWRAQSSGSLFSSKNKKNATQGSERMRVTNTKDAICGTFSFRLPTYPKRTRGGSAIAHNAKTVGERILNAWPYCMLFCFQFHIATYMTNQTTENNMW